MSTAQRVGQLSLAFTLVVGTAAIAQSITPSTVALPATSLTLSTAAEAPVCSGPETLITPAGARAQRGSGPATVSSMVARATLLRTISLSGASLAGGASGSGPGASAAPGSRSSSPTGTEPVIQLHPDPIESGAGPVATTGTPAAAGSPGQPTPPIVTPEVHRLGTLRRLRSGSAEVAGTVDASGSRVGIGSTTISDGGAVVVDASAVPQPPSTGSPARLGLPAVASSQTSWATDGELRGLAAQNCLAAGTDLWLVGSATTSGRRSRLLISNPTTAPATVDITVYGEGGPVQAPAGSGVVIPANTAKALVVEALAPGLSSIVVRVRATSGRVSALLHDELLRGTTPGGVDDVTAGASPASVQELPGLSIERARQGVTGDVLPSSPDAAGAVAIRIGVPGAGDAVVRVRLLGPAGNVAWVGGVATVPGGTVVDLPVTGVADGTYTAVVQADAPVVAGALVGRAELSSSQAGTSGALGQTVAPAEFGWIAAAAPLRSAAAVAVPALQNGLRATLVFGAPGNGTRDVSWVEIGDDGSLAPIRSTRLGADSSMAVDLAPSTRGVIVAPADHGAEPVVATVMLSVAAADGELISYLAVRPSRTVVSAHPKAVQDPGLGL